MESAANFDIRTAKAEQDHEIVVRYEREKSDYAEAKSIYFAEIISKTDYFARREYGRPFLNEVVVKPVGTVRGIAPTASQVLVNSYPHRCEMDGHGYAASGQIGELVIVFEGVKTHGLNGIDSLMAKHAHSKGLVEAIDEHIAKTDGGPFKVDEQGNALERQADGSFKLPEISDPFPK